MTRTVNQIIAEVASATDVPLADLMTGKSHDASGARQLAIWLARKITGKSLPALGRDFNRHHTTILYSVRYQTDMMRAYPEERRFAEGLLKRLRG